MSDELKPCPFCGATVMVITENEGVNYSYIHCFKCGANFCLDEKELVKTWNRRSK